MFALGLVTVRAGGFSVSADQAEGEGVFKFGDFRERMLLPVAGSTIAAIVSLVRVLMARRAGLVESEKTLLPFGEDFQLRVRMTGFATDGEVFSGELKIESLVVKSRLVGNSGERETSAIGDRKAGPLVFAVTAAAVKRCPRFVRGEVAVETGSAIDLCGDIVVAGQTRLFHGLVGAAVTGGAVVRPRQTRVLCVDG